MTENEAKLLEKLDELANDSEVDMYSVATLNAYFEECGNTIRGLLEEIKKYRAIGTVEDVQSKLEACRELGTMEELKALKEKSEPKSRLLQEGRYYCPICGKIAEMGYCKACGQNLY